MKWRMSNVQHAHGNNMRTLSAKTKITSTIALLLLFPAAVFANVPEPEYVPGSLIIERNPDEQFTQRTQQSLGLFGVQDVALQQNIEDENISIEGTFIEVQLPSDHPLIVNAAIEHFEALPGVESVEREQIRRITLAPNDEKYQLQDHLEVASEGGIATEDAWEVQTGSEEVVVAVIDTGVDTDHPDIADNMWVNEDEIPNNDEDDDGNGYIDDYYGYDFTNSNGNPNPNPDGDNEDGFGGADTGVTHGTHVAGILGAQGDNEVGGTGVAWDVSIMAIQVLDDEGSGTDRAIANGIEYAVENGADVIHMSLGGYGSTNALKSGVDAAKDAGIPIVGAAGNDGVDINLNPFYPACYSGVLGVGSTSANNTASSFSNYGDDCVDVSAPGETIYSTLYTGDSDNGFTDDYGRMSGTSMAAPVVSGIYALLLSEQSGLSSDQLATIVTLTTDSVDISKQYGSGRVNAASAVNGIDLVDNPPAPILKAWKNSKRKKEFESGKRRAIQRPYFTWNEPTDEDGINGYYVYFGTDKNANPVSKGDFQTEREFQPSSKLEGNEKSYYLRVSAVDGEDRVSNEPASFQYVIDTVVKRPKKFTISRAKDGIQVRWRKLSNEHIQQYKVYRKQIFKKKKKNRKSKYNLVASVKKKRKQYVDKKVVPGKRYRYRVKAVDNFGNERVTKTKVKKFVPREDIVVATATGAPKVRIYDATNKEFSNAWTAYHTAGVSGVEVATGDVDGDGRDEIITVPAVGGTQLKVFSADGKVQSAFFAFEHSGTARITVGNFVGDGREEIAAFSADGSVPQLRIFAADGSLVSEHSGVVAAMLGGAHIAAVNWDGGALDELALAVNGSRAGHVVVYSPELRGVVSSINAYPNGVQGNVRVAAVSAEKTQKQVLATSPEHGAVQVRQFELRDGAPVQAEQNFYGFVQEYTGGSSLSAGRVNGPKRDYVIVGSNGGRQATIQMFNATGKTLEETIFPFGGYTGGIHLATGWF